MYIKKITFKNFRIFKDKITLNLQPNWSQVDSSKFWGNYKIVNDKAKKYASIINGIGGANSSGKTTFIKGFELLKKSKDEFEMQQAYFKYIDQKIDLYIEKNKKRPDNLREILNEAEKEIFSKSGDEFKPNKHFEELTGIERKRLFNKNISSCFRELSDHDISIKLDLFDEKQDFSFEYTLNTKRSNEIFLDSEGKKIQDKNKNYKYIEKTLKNILILNDDKQNKKSLKEIFINLLKELKDKNTKKCENENEIFLNLIKIADNNIAELDISNGSFKGFVLKNGMGTVNFYDLSTGTKKLVENFYRIFEAFKKAKKEKYTCLILIDEIENSLHFRLVDLIKQLVFDYSEDGNKVQLFYTSHNINSLDRAVDYKQIYFLERSDFDGKIIFERASKNLKGHNSLTKQFLNAKIGSHPSKFDIESFCEETVDRM